jgi:hypothetical protein
MRRLASASAAIACVAFAARSEAQSQPRIEVRAFPDQVEVGEAFNVQVTATVQDGDPPQDAELPPSRDYDVVAKVPFRSRHTEGFGPRRTTIEALNMTWQVVAKRPGKLTIPAPVVIIGGKRITTSPQKITVVPAGTGPRGSRSPFLLPGQGFSFQFQFPGDDEPQPEPRINTELSLPSAPDPTVFVRTTVDKKSVVIGEQVKLSTYIYWSSEGPRVTSNHEAPLADFLRRQLSPDAGAEREVLTTAGGTKFAAKLVDEIAIFPLRAGDLHTGQVRYGFDLWRTRRHVERASDDLVIHVVEPPRTGRPPGYVLGDVGQFTLAASVAPRKVDQGGEVSVTLRLSGTGNLPQTLRVPERTGVEWLDPEKKESIEPQRGVIGGWRTFGYVVRIKDAGSINLGEVTLPYWDPATKKYEIAKAELGVVEVSPKAPLTDPVTKEPLEAPQADPFVAMPGARKELGAYTATRARLFDGRSAWLFIAAPPMLVGLVSLSARAVERARKRRATAKDSPAALAQKALADAREAEAKGDGKTLTAALERALHLAIEAATGLKSRGVLVADLPGELAERGIAADLADEVASALAECDAVRFEPSPDLDRARELAKEARGLVARLAEKRT